MHEKPTKFKKVFAIGKRNCTGRIVSTHLTGRFCASWNKINFNLKRIWVKQFKTGKEVTYG